MLQVRCDRSIGAGKIRRITNRIRSNTRSIKPRPVPFSYKATKNPLYGESDSAEWRMEEQDQRSDRRNDGQSGEKASRIWRGEGEVIHGS
jgi:galactose mutarotase-like enzyme